MTIARSAASVTVPSFVLNSHGKQSPDSPAEEQAQAGLKARTWLGPFALYFGTARKAVPDTILYPLA